MLRRILITAALSGAPLFAQGTCYQIPDDATIGTVRPFGGSVQDPTSFRIHKYQMLVLSTELGKGDICELAFVPTGTGVRHFDSLRISLGYFGLTGTELSTTYSSNLPNPTNVLDIKNHEWPHTKDTFNPIGLQNSFAYDPKVGHLVIEVIATGAYLREGWNGTAYFRSSQRKAIDNQGWTTEPTTGFSTYAFVRLQICYQTAMADVYGLGCRGLFGFVPTLTFGGTPKLNSAFSLDVVGGRSNGNMFLVLGLQRMQTPLLLPGAEIFNCHLYISPDVVLLHKMTSTGTYSQQFTVPSDTRLTDFKVWVQAFPWDPINAFGTSATNYGRLRIGQ